MYALVDCNNFYCSCEQVFQPKLIGKPLIVLSNNDGCAISRSEEAKKLGIRMGDVAHKIQYTLRRNNVQVRSSNYTLYDDMSGRVMRTLARFVQHMEVYSIDEAFLSFHGMEQHHDLYQLGRTIKATIQRNQGIPVCVGIAETKTLAKLANHYAKKKYREEGVYLADTPEKYKELVEWAPLSEVWGIGRQYCKMLNGHGYHTVAQLLAAPEDFIRKAMSVVGHRTLKELKGIPCIPWLQDDEDMQKKGICSSRSFGDLMDKKTPVQHAIAEYASQVAYKLRLQNGVCNRLFIWLNTNPHRTEHPQYHPGISCDLLSAANDTPTIVKMALEGLEMIWRDKHWYMKGGVMAERIHNANTVQASLWEQPADRSKLNSAMAALDSINATYGKHTVKVASMGQHPEVYAMRRNHLSGNYTTDIKDIPKVKD